MAKLPEVLQEGDAGLSRQAIEVHYACSRRLGVHAVQDDMPEIPRPGLWNSRIIASRLIRRYAEYFTALRNNLVHAQDIVTHDWTAIARIASQLEEAVLLRRSHPGGGMTADTLPQGKRM